MYADAVPTVQSKAERLEGEPEGTRPRRKFILNDEGERRSCICQVPPSPSPMLSTSARPLPKAKAIA